MRLGSDSASSPSALSQGARKALQAALNAQDDQSRLLREERSIRQPDSWLVERCWMTLARAGAAESALVLASLTTHRQPLAMPTALRTLSASVQFETKTGDLVRSRLDQHGMTVLDAAESRPEALDEDLILTASAAVQAGIPRLALSCLERLDQLAGGWTRTLRSTELRPALAATLAALEPHPLTRHLVRSAIPRFELDGARFLNELAGNLVDGRGQVRPGREPTMRQCLRAVAHLATGEVSIRRFAAAVQARGGEGKAALDTVRALSTMLEARQETAPPARDADESILRHVVRERADMDVDFQVFALQDCLQALPEPERKGDVAAELAESLASLAGRSDGWTASSAVAALVAAGWFEPASRLAANVAPADSTRSDSVCGLIEGLLAAGQHESADAEMRRYWDWIQTLEDDHVKWLTLRRLAELYVQAGRAEQGLKLLQPQPRRGWWSRLRRARESVPEERQLEENRIRLLCLLARLDAGQPTGEARSQVRKLANRAQSLLQGESLAGYLLRLLPPLLDAGRWECVPVLLPAIQRALGPIKGHRHAVRTREFSALLARALGLAPAAETARLAQELSRWVQDFWMNAPAGGIWQVVYSIDGCLELVHALEGPQPLLDIGRHAHNANRELEWGRAVDSAVQREAAAI